MIKKIFIQCSNCGEHRMIPQSYETEGEMYLVGYRAVGDVLYCPNCVKSWKERNGKEFDEVYKDPVSMFCRWARSKGFTLRKRKRREE